MCFSPPASGPFERIRARCSVWPVLVLVVALSAGGIAWWLLRIRAGLVGAASTYLRMATFAWKAAGRPQDAALKGFMTNLPPFVHVSNRVFELHGGKLATQFCTDRLGFEGTLFITTNDTLILLEPHGFRLVESGGTAQNN